MAKMDSDFLEEQRRAVERMNEMYKRQKINDDAHPMPPTPDFVRVNNSTGEKSVNSRQKYEVSKTHNKTENTNQEEKFNSNKNYNANQNSAGSNNFLNGFFGNITLPFTNGKKLDRDITLIIGLLLILASENADRKLMFALLYILM